MAAMYKNGDRIAEDSETILMVEFADPVTENYMFDAAMTELRFVGEFEFVLNNDVYLITKD